MSTLHTLATGSAVGGLLPLLTAVVQRPHWAVPIKKAVAVVMALVAGIVTVVSADGLDQFQHGAALATLATVVAASQSAYDLIWKPTQIGPTIETATSPKSAPAAE
ncbi:hypothetical protein ABZ352_18585 [Streptomyces griseofuscus]|uniref:hypothetical protein n=1 Tax=Streptomyces griseofuscus TaxID=146922 RepID=UPI003403240B